MSVEALFFGMAATKRKADSTVYLRASTPAEFAAAIAAADPSSWVSIAIEQDINVNSAVVIPANIQLTFNGSKLTRSIGGSIEFEGIGLANPLRPVGILSGFAAGEITWTGTAPSRISTEVIATGTASLSERLAILTAAFVNKAVVFVASPRTQTIAVTLNDGHSLHLLAGEYPNTVATNIPPPLTIGDSATLSGDVDRVTGERLAIFYESSVNLKTALVWTADGAENVLIENIRFQGHAANSDPAGLAGVWFYNAQNSIIRNCFFDGCHSFNAVIGKYPTLPGLSSGCKIQNNTFRGFKTQSIAVTNGINWEIAGNVLDYRDALDPGPFFVPIDIEPNDFTDIISDFKINDNTIITAGSIDYNTGIAIQGDICRLGARNGEVKRNKLFAADGPGDPLGHTQQMLAINGSENVDISDNFCQGTYITPIDARNCSSLTIARNTLLQNEGGFRLISLLSSLISENEMSNEFAIPGGALGSSIIEIETQIAASSVGAIITAGSSLNGSYWKFKPWHVGQTITFNGAEYTIQDVLIDVHPTSARMTTNVGTVANKTFAPGNVTAGSGNIAIAGHGFITGSAVNPTTTGVLPVNAELIVGTAAYVIVVDANNIKLASSLANAIGNVPLTYSGTGAGVNTLSPVITTKFSSNTYSRNSVPDGITLESSGSSIVT